ncbi:hypothetical protein EPUS_08912 [Endocarpon pusillum Z07020]|uniref:Uncharacterized protein n=1 Tax=Endocarpon pusillum (strain Z07020 / HMAS-L-300199) TaxID=1263415 RepID=U1HZZ5_ENDPU|nr:uncharacterized protein EPUS_08912 [Endocarpon pusillum Z07020]ERF76520.1 hypothetical protein EPUS_08912 [Endocarpon pusillum Z07020]
MSELNFAKTFLQTLDAKSTKYPPNHVFDAKTFPTRIPFTLPKLPQPPHPPYPKSTPSAPPPPGATRTTSTISLTLKSSRNPALALTLPDIDPFTTTISQLRETVQSDPARCLCGAPDPPPKTDTTPANEAGQTTDKAADVPSEGMEGIETVTSPPPPPPPPPPGKEILETEQFWKDLQGYLEQRIKDEAEAASLVQKWKGDWQRRD